MEKKTVSEVGEWLTEEGFSDSVVTAFKDNDIDGEAFLLLEEGDIKELISSIGGRRKLIARRKMLSDKAASETPLREHIETVEKSPEQSSNSEIEIQESNDLGFSSTTSSDDSDGELLLEPQEPKEIETVISKAQDGLSIFSPCRSKNIITKREPEPPLPIPFELPRNFPALVMTDLHKGKLSVKGKAKFISSVGAAIFRFKSYPEKDEYDHVAQQIIKKYPFLRSSSGTGYGYLKEGLQDKMKYLRNAGKPKRAVSALEGSSDVEPPPKKPRPEFKQFPSIVSEPPIPDGEDSSSYARNNKMLLQEEKKLNPNKKTISTLMERTFAFRRQEIMRNPKPLQELLKLYPSLKRLNQLGAELDRIAKKEISASAITKWSELVPKIIHISQEENNSYINAFIDDKMSYSNSGKSLLALVIVCYLIPDTRVKPDHNKVISFVKEDADAVLEAKAQCHPQPKILVTGSPDNPKDTYLVTEGQLLCKIPAVEQCPSILLASFYAFNMQYTTGCTNFYSFLEYVFLGNVPPKRCKLQYFITSIENCNIE